MRFDPQTNDWKMVAPMSMRRCGVAVLNDILYAVLCGFLYAIGEQDGAQCLNQVERYDPKENKWSKVTPMTTRRLGVVVAVLGSGGQCPLNTVKRYNPRQSEVQSILSPLVAIILVALFSIITFMPLVGVIIAWNYLKQNVSIRIQILGAMTSRGSGVGLALFNGQLYGGGGFDGPAYLKTIEEYDPESFRLKQINGVYLL